MNRTKLILALLLASLLVPAAFLLLRSTEPEKGLLVYCAAGMRVPMAEIAAAYEEEYGVPVELQFGGSGTLLGNLEASGTGDLYLAADTSYVDIAREKGLVEERLPVAYLTAGLLVAKGNPKGVSSLQDLAGREDLRVTMANPEAAAVGRFTRRVLREAGLWDSISARVLVTKPTVNELANDVKLGTADVAIAWDALAEHYPALDFVSVPAFEEERRHVTIGVLASAASPASALRFARYASARDRGLETFRRHGYAVLDEADRWERRPELLFFSGAMLGPAIEKRMARFREREGVDLEFVPNGCGILVSQMKAGARPDAYFSCDISFMDDVADLFGPSTVVSGNDLVVLASNRVRDRVSTLGDLAAPGMRLGLAHPDKSALGALTVRMLAALGVDLSANKELDSATGDFLVNQLRAGSLDAVIVYRSNARADADTLEEACLVEIDHPLALARQPFAVGRESDFPQLSARLYEALTGEAGKAEFLRYGFRWELPE